MTQKTKSLPQKNQKPQSKQKKQPPHKPKPQKATTETSLQRLAVEVSKLNNKINSIDSIRKQNLLEKKYETVLYFIFEFTIELAWDALMFLYEIIFKNGVLLLLLYVLTEVSLFIRLVIIKVSTLLGDMFDDVFDIINDIIGVLNDIADVLSDIGGGVCDVVNIFGADCSGDVGTIDPVDNPPTGSSWDWLTDMKNVETVCQGFASWQDELDYLFKRYISRDSCPTLRHVYPSNWVFKLLDAFIGWSSLNPTPDKEHNCSVADDSDLCFWISIGYLFRFFMIMLIVLIAISCFWHQIKTILYGLLWLGKKLIHYIVEAVDHIHSYEEKKALEHSLKKVNHIRTKNNQPTIVDISAYSMYAHSNFLVNIFDQ